MTHLRIEQSGSANVSYALLTQLYNYANAGLDSTSNISGSISVPHAKPSQISLLLALYPDLTINVTSGNYLDFDDPTVETICASSWGDGTGITASQAATVTNANFGNTFKGNTTITSFDELANFISVTEINGYYGSEFEGGFYHCTALTSIDLNNITSVYRGGFHSCTSLQTVKNFHPTTLQSDAFRGCSSLSSIDLSTVTEIPDGCFTNCTALAIDVNAPRLTNLGVAFQSAGVLSATNLGSITTIVGQPRHYNGGTFAKSKLRRIVIPATVTSIGELAFWWCARMEWVQCLATTPPTLDSSAFSDTNNTFKIYVPDASVSTYQSASNWSNFSSRIKPLSQFSTDFPNA